ncbi:hypothetical protein BDZ91DRAFT_721915 [Kalaharituber pfeilii]|nr:hypothetical protein BDZ91DRAFT_721915 [Kalaharituber pfeilii]
MAPTSAAALKAATLSFQGVKATGPVKGSHSRTPSISSAVPRSGSSSRSRSRSSSTVTPVPVKLNGTEDSPRDRSSPVRPVPRASPAPPSTTASTAANMAWPSLKPEAEHSEALPPRGSVRDAKRRLFNDTDGANATSGLSPATTLSSKASARRHSRSNSGPATPDKKPLRDVDVSSIEDTSSLVSLFEAKGGRGAGGGDTSSLSSASVLASTSLRTPSRPVKPSTSPSLAIFAPQPLRAGLENQSMTAAKLASQLSPPTSRAPSVLNSPTHTGSKGDADGVGPGLDIIPTIALHEAHPSLHTKRSDVTSTSTQSRSTKTNDTPRRPSSQPSQKQPPPQPPPPRRGNLKHAQSEKAEASGTDSEHEIFVDAPEQFPASSSASSAPRLLMRRGSVPAIPMSQKPDPLPTQGFLSISSNHPISSNLTGSSTAHSHAVLASSIASTRDPTPIPPAQPIIVFPGQKKKVPPPPPPLRRRRSAPSIGPSSGGIRATMRPSDKKKTSPHRHPYGIHDDTGKKASSAHHRMLKNHKHKHAAGSHPRWKSESVVGEKERKRYEGVWAANRGYLMHTMQILPRDRGNEAEEKLGEIMRAAMHPLVVRDIWSRSRLNTDHLSEIWRLVDREAKGWLDRDEFVVGMWLVDRCLQGRKLPVKVVDGVWGSVRRLGVVT